MKNLIIGLFISGSVLAQNQTTPEYSYAEFNALENVKDQEAYYQEMLQANPDADYDTYLIALAIANLDHGNTDKYKFYTRSNPEFSAIALINLVYALEHLEGEDEKIVKQFFNKNVRTFLENNQNLFVEGFKDTLIVYYDKTILSSDEIKSMLNLIDKICKVFKIS